jgi:hypothetical protein
MVWYWYAIVVFIAMDAGRDGMVRVFEVLAQGQALVDAHELIFRETYASEFLKNVNVRVGFTKLRRGTRFFLHA